jgi:hypothetical protein
LRITLKTLGIIALVIWLASDSRYFTIREGIVQFIHPQDLEDSNRYFASYYNRLVPLYSLLMKAVFLPFGGERKARIEI